MKKLSKKQRELVQAELAGIINIRSFWEVQFIKNKNNKTEREDAALKLGQCDSEIARLSNLLNEN